MQKLLVTGASGFVGRFLCTELLARGYFVRAAVRSQLAITEGERVNVPDIAHDTDWTAALADIDTVIHLAARVHVMYDNAADPLHDFRKLNVAGTMHLARMAAASGVQRLIYVSSIKVNGERTSLGQQYSELDDPAPEDPYGISKYEAEQALHRIAAETGLEVVIVRPPLVYGPTVKGNFEQMMNVLAKGIPLPLASVKNLRSLVYVGNLVDALILCASHPAAVGQTYLVSDGEDISTPNLLRGLGIAMNRPARLLPCPAALLKVSGSLFRKREKIERLLGSLRVDSSKIRRDLDWTPPFTVQQGLQATVQ